jgi:hypothetical protein
MLRHSLAVGSMSFMVSCCVALSSTIFLSSATWAAPTITDVSLRGLQVGGTTVIAIRGQELLPEPRLVLPLPILRQDLRPGGTAELIEIAVELGTQATPGIAPLRIQSAHGISNSVSIGVDRLPEQAFVSEISLLPMALHGTIRGAEIRRTSFAGRRGMRITADVEARRLGSQLRPVVRILDDQGRQLAWDQGMDSLQGDARTTITLPSDGLYQVELHDLLYRGPDPGFFRLKIGSFDFADQVFPAGVQRGQTAHLQLLSHGKTPTSVQFAPPAEHGYSSLAVVSRSPWFTGIPPAVAVTDHPELVEEGANKPTSLAEIPVGVSGRIAAPKEEARYLLAVQPGTTLRLEMYAQRIGSPLDGVLLVQNEQGQTLARGDDQPGTTDPGLDFQVPEGTTQVQLVVQDLLGQGGVSSIYRLVVHDQAAPRFSLTVDQERINAAPASGALLRVTAERHGFGGPIDLVVEGLGEIVEVTGAKIPAGSNHALLALHAGEPLASLQQLRILGNGSGGERPIRSLAKAPERVEANQQPWYGSTIPLAIVGDGGMRVSWNSTDESLPRGGEMTSQLEVQRGSASMGNVRIRLETTQPMPRKKIKEDNQEKEIDDVDRSLRLKDPILLESSQTEATAHVLIPEDLPEVEWGMIFVAELLGDDGETVLATAFTETRFFKAHTPPPAEENSEEETKR